MSEDSLERLPLQVLHDEVVAATLLTHFVRLDDVGMAEARREAGLVEEHPYDVVVVLSDAVPQHLDDDELLKRTYTGFGDREVHVGHPAARDLGHEAVLAREQVLVLIGVARHDLD